MKILSISDLDGRVGAQYKVPHALAAALTDLARRITRDFVEAPAAECDTNSPAGVSPVGSFSWALMRLKAGARVCRRGWGERPKTLRLAGPIDFSPAMRQFIGGNKLPFLREMEADGRYQPWTPGHADLLAEDWEEVE